MQGPNLRKIEREPLWDLAHTQLRESVLAGRFAPGSKLTLRYLAEIFGTSITPVRDAITRLAAQGVLQLGPRNCAVVPELTVTELRELTTIRCELEGRAAYEAALNRDDEALARLAEQLATMRGFIAGRKLSAYLAAHRKFHFGIYAAAGMPILNGLVENLWLRCGPSLSFVVPEYVLLLKGTDYHKTVLDALHRRDARKAEKAWVWTRRDAATSLQPRAGKEGQVCGAAGAQHRQRH